MQGMGNVLSMIYDLILVYLLTTICYNRKKKKFSCTIIISIIIYNELKKKKNLWNIKFILKKSL